MCRHQRPLQHSAKRGEEEEQDDDEARRRALHLLSLRRAGQGSAGSGRGSVVGSVHSRGSAGLATFFSATLLLFLGGSRGHGRERNERDRWRRGGRRGLCLHGLLLEGRAREDGPLLGELGERFATTASSCSSLSLDIRIIQQGCAGGQRGAPSCARPRRPAADGGHGAAAFRLRIVLLIGSTHVRKSEKRCSRGGGGGGGARRARAARGALAVEGRHALVVLLRGLHSPLLGGGPLRHYTVRVLSLGRGSRGSGGFGRGIHFKCFPHKAKELLDGREGGDKRVYHYPPSRCSLPSLVTECRQ